MSGDVGARATVTDRNYWQQAVPPVSQTGIGMERSHGPPCRMLAQPGQAQAFNRRAARK
jgi:hypothetical protein